MLAIVLFPDEGAQTKELTVGLAMRRLKAVVGAMVNCVSQSMDQGNVGSETECSPVTLVLQVGDTAFLVVG